MAGPLRGEGGGGKGPAIKDQITFFGTFKKVLVPFKNKKYFTLDNLGRYFICVVTIFSKK